MTLKTSFMAIGVVATLGFTSLLATGSSAAAADGCGAGGCGAPPAASGGQTITVTVSGSFISGGSPGQGGGTTTVTVTPPCFLTSAHQSGKDYYDYVTSGQAKKDYYKFDRFDGISYRASLIPGYLDHQDDVTGTYYDGQCDSATFQGSTDAFIAFTTQWFKDHAGTYVPAGGTPPIPPVPPETLVQAAQKAMTLPLPLFDHNPKAGAEAFTLVNLPTWFWLTNPTTTGQVTASIPGSAATITATLASAVFSSPTAGEVACAGTGVTWTLGATSDCTLTFPHQTAGEQVTASTSWGLHWVYDGQLGHRVGDLAAVGSQATATVPVREAQAINTGSH